jgi:hypothetical protein
VGERQDFLWDEQAERLEVAEGPADAEAPVRDEVAEAERRRLRRQSGILGIALGALLVGTRYLHVGADYRPAWIAECVGWLLVIAATLWQARRNPGVYRQRQVVVAVALAAAFALFDVGLLLGNWPAAAAFSAVQEKRWSDVESPLSEAERRIEQPGFAIGFGHIQVKTCGLVYQHQDVSLMITRAEMLLVKGDAGAARVKAEAALNISRHEGYSKRLQDGAKRFVDAVIRVQQQRRDAPGGTVDTLPESPPI